MLSILNVYYTFVHLFAMILSYVNNFSRRREGKKERRKDGKPRALTEQQVRICGLLDTLEPPGLPGEFQFPPGLKINGKS